jgi:hypothetical protein
MTVKNHKKKQFFGSKGSNNLVTLSRRTDSPPMKPLQIYSMFTVLYCTVPRSLTRSS